MSAPSDVSPDAPPATDVVWRVEALSEAAWTRLARILVGPRKGESDQSEGDK